MNTMVCGGLLSLMLVAGFAAYGYQVSSVSARQHWPWDNKVDVDFTVSDAEAGKPFFVDIAATYPGVVGDELTAKTLLSEPVVAGDGTYRFVWDVGADAPGLYTTNFNVRVTLTPYSETSPVYMVIDISGGASAASYPVRYTTQAPDLSSDVCRTTEMWLRRCPACTFTMGKGTAASGLNYPAHTVVLTKPFYMGIFEVTRAQWNLIKGGWPMGETTDTDKAAKGVLPVAKVSMYDIWGQPTFLCAGSFIANLKVRSGLSGLNLPTEAQWECACRAGSTGDYYWPEITGANMPNWASGNWWYPDVGFTGALKKVGSYPANPWGLYDMYGNADERVSDYDGTVASEEKIQAEINAGKFVSSPENIAAYFTDPKGWPGHENEGSGVRIFRGGSCLNDAGGLNSYSRGRIGFGDGSGAVSGLRVCATVQ